MKSLKKIKSKKFFAIVLLGMILSLNATDASAFERHRHRHHKDNGGDGGNTVGAPLDGGIITILLGGAGVAYFARKRRKNNEQ